MADGYIHNEDSVVFLAMFLGGGGPYALDGVIAVFDWVNHAIPRTEDIEEALRRLVGSGVVEVRADKYRVSAKAAADFQIFRRKHRKDRFLMADKFLEKTANRPVE